MKRTNKIVSAFLNLLKVASYVSLCACSGNQVKDKCIQTAGDLLPEVKEQENVQNKEVSDKSNEAEKNHDKLTNLLVTYQSVKKGNNKDQDDKETFSSTKHAKSKTNKKAKGSNGNSSPRHKRNKSSISVSSISDLTTTPILGDLSIDFDVTGKLKINNCSYRVTTENEFKVCLEYLERAKKEKKSIKGLDSIFPKAEKERKGHKDSVRLWKKDWFWKSINAYWNLFKDLNLQTFSIKSPTDATNKEKVYIEGLGITDFLFSDIVKNNKQGESLDSKRKKTKTVAEIKDEYNNVFYINADRTPRPQNNNV